MDRVYIGYCFFILFCSVPNSDSLAIDEASKFRQSTSSQLERSSTRRGALHQNPGVNPSIHFPTEPPSDDKVGAYNRGIFTDLPPPSPCPDDALFCEYADDYPKDVIKNRLKKLPELLHGVLYQEVLGEEVHNKFGPEIEKELCTSKAKIVFPNKAKSKEGVFEFVVNDEEHKQGIRVETCTNSGGGCDVNDFILSTNYKSKCVQKYITRQLVVLNQEASSDVNGIITKPFEFPSCCSCVIRKLGTTESRFGGEHNTTPANITAPPTEIPVKGKPKSVN